MRRKVQVVLVELPGAEPWVLVKHAKGHFKLPQGVPISELLAGALAGWGTRPKRSTEAAVWVRVPLQTYLASTRPPRIPPPD